MSQYVGYLDCLRVIMLNNRPRAIFIRVVNIYRILVTLTLSNDSGSRSTPFQEAFLTEAEIEVRRTNKRRVKKKMPTHHVRKFNLSQLGGPLRTNNNILKHNPKLKINRNSKRWSVPLSHSSLGLSISLIRFKAVHNTTTPLFKGGFVHYGGILH